MTTRLGLAVIALAAAAALAGCASTQTPSALGARAVAKGVTISELPRLNDTRIATVEGAVTDLAGEPMFQTTVYFTRDTGTDARPETLALLTDPQGRYRAVRLLPGRYIVRTDKVAEGQLLAVETLLDVRGGDHINLDLAFRGLVRTAGRLTFGGAKAPENGFEASLVDTATGDHTTLALDREGGYFAYLRPGTYRVAAMTGAFGMRQHDGMTYTIPDTASGHALDLDIPASDVSVTVQPPEGGKFSTGYLASEYRTYTDSAVSRIRMDEPTATIKGVMPGTYEIGFLREDGMQGVSAPFTVAAGKPASITIGLTQPADRVFHGRFNLPKGRHEYKFFSPVDMWQDDIFNPMKIGAGTMTNSVLEIPGGAKDTDGARSPWPRVDDTTGDVEFWVRMPTLNDTCYVRGSFNNWRVDPAYRLERVPEATYEITISLKPGTYAYKFYSTDDVWWLDSNNPVRTGDGLLINNTITMPSTVGAPTPDGHPRIDPAAGTVTFRTLVSSRTGEVYLRGDFNNWEKSADYRLKRVP